MRPIPIRNALYLSALLVAGALLVDSEADYESEVSSIKDDLEYDENGKLTSFHLLYPSDQPDCPASIFNPWYGFEKHAVAGDALKLVFPDYQPGDSNCVAACIERGADRSVACHAMPHQHYNAETSDESFRNWFESECYRMEVCLINYWNIDEPLTLNWINHETGEAELKNIIRYGETNAECFQSYLGHMFEVRDGEDEMIEEFTIDHGLVKAFGEAPPSDDITARTFDKEIESTLKDEWRRHNIVKRTFSPLGFSKGRLPPDIFASMGAWFYNNRHNKVREQWRGKGVYVNWWESNVSVIHMPVPLRIIWQERLAELVSTWAGVPVEQTFTYGMRQYEDGARLLTHVDRISTHAVSLIVNVAQGNLTEPWPIEVFDHADRLHEVLMEPGDIVYYESAKNLHSRNRPLKGKNGYYVNLFTHYRPIEDGELWNEKTDQVGVPDPVIDVEGECRLQQEGTTGTASGQLGIVYQVQCDDERLGPYVSPSLFQAKGPDDLIDWWRKTASGYVEETSASSTTSGKDEL